jgi:hypothetical protein
MKYKFTIILFLLSISVFQSTSQNTFKNTRTQQIDAAENPPSGAGLRPVSLLLLLPVLAYSQNIDYIFLITKD